VNSISILPSHVKETIEQNHDSIKINVLSISHNMGVFGIMVAVAVQSAFRLEMHQNKVFFLFFKNYF